MMPIPPTPSVARLGQIVLYGAFAALLALFSHWPPYRHLAPDQALIKLSFVHHGALLGDCVAQTPAELAKLPPNMRAPLRCPRERSPVTVEIDIDGVLAHRELADPTGLSRDGAAAVYQRLPIAAGEHRLAVRLKDNAQSAGFDFSREAQVTLAPAQILVIDFDPVQRRITLQ